MKKCLSVLLSLACVCALSSLAVAAASPVARPGNEAFRDSELVWTVAPTLEYDSMLFHPDYGFLAATPNNEEFVIDEKTGETLREFIATGGLRTPFEYGYYPKTGAFFYFEEYEQNPEKTDVVIRESQNTALAVYEVEWYGEYKIFDAKEGGKYAIFCNGEFVSDFVYDLVIGGDSTAFVKQNDKYALADGSGNLVTEFIFDDVALTTKGYIAVKKGSAWGFVDASGKEMIPFIFDHALNIDADTAFVKYNGKYGVLDVKKTAGRR